MKSGAIDGMQSSVGISLNNQRTKLMKWLSKTLIEGDHLVVCTDEADYYRTLRSMKIPVADWDRWLMQDSLATTHYFNTPKGSRVTIVCIPVTPATDGIDVATLLVHEAVHVVQEYFRYICEDNPGTEIEAYAIQNVSASLMRAYRDKLFPKPKKEKKEVGTTLTNNP
jgi:hypothetical protein